MKVKQMIGVLQLGDASDHHDVSTGGWRHEEGCDYCLAARAAEHLMTMNLVDFDAGDPVEIVGGIRGRVVGMDTVVRVELHGESGRGPFAIGTFSPHELKLMDGKPEFTYWADREGDVWQRQESTGIMRVFKLHDTEMPESLPSWEDCRWQFTHVQKTYGLLTQVSRP